MAWTRKGKMYEAIKAGDISTVKRLVDDGFDITPSGYGRTPLLFAVAYGRKDIVELFILKGANFVDFYREDGITSSWQTLLHVAAAQGHKDVATLLIESDKYDRTLINKRDTDQNTALHLAAANGHKEIVQLLLDKGFDPNMTGANGKLAIGYANQGGHVEIVRLLEERMHPKRAQESVIKAEPAAAPAASQEKWSLANEYCVAQVSEMKDLGYKITEVFNFASRERIRIVNNLKTKADNFETTAFDDLPDRKQLLEAFDALERLGGKADRSALEPKNGKRHLPPPAAKGN